MLYTKPTQLFNAWEIYHFLKKGAKPLWLIFAATSSFDDFSWGDPTYKVSILVFYMLTLFLCELLHIFVPYENIIWQNKQILV